MRHCIVRAYDMSGNPMSDILYEGTYQMCRLFIWTMDPHTYALYDFLEDGEELNGLSILDADTGRHLSFVFDDFYRMEA